MLSGCPEADQNQWRGAIDPPGSVDRHALVLHNVRGEMAHRWTFSTVHSVICRHVSIVNL